MLTPLLVWQFFAAAHDVSEGGIAQTIVEMAMRSGVGVRLEVPQEAFVAALATDADIEKVKAARK